MTETTLADRLRRWAQGMYTTEAATELLIRAHHGRFAQPGNPWIHTEDDDWAWVEFGDITDKTTGVLSGGERRMLLLAAGLATARPVDLSDAITGLDRHHVQLVLAALAHAAGSHQHNDIRRDPTTGTAEFIELKSLFPWPPEKEVDAHRTTAAATPPAAQKAPPPIQTTRRDLG